MFKFLSRTLFYRTGLFLSWLKVKQSHSQPPTFRRWRRWIAALSPSITTSTTTMAPPLKQRPFLCRTLLNVLAVKHLSLISATAEIAGGHLADLAVNLIRYLDLCLSQQRPSIAITTANVPREATTRSEDGSPSRRRRRMKSTSRCGTAGRGRGRRSLGLLGSRYSARSLEGVCTGFFKMGISFWSLYLVMGGGIGRYLSGHCCC